MTQTEDPIREPFFQTSWKNLIAVQGELGLEPWMRKAYLPEDGRVLEMQEEVKSKMDSGSGGNGAAEEFV